MHILIELVIVFVLILTALCNVLVKYDSFRFSELAVVARNMMQTLAIRVLLLTKTHHYLARIV